MQVTQIPDGIMNTEVPKPTNEEIQNEYNYIFAEQLTKKLLEKGLVSDDEFEKIMAKNRRSFQPFLSRIKP
ncbi:MAG: SHOCT domain-containing protein [Anaerovoracaceae bacterium]